MQHMTALEAENSDLFAIEMAHKDVPVVDVLIGRIRELERSERDVFDGCACGCEYDDDDHKAAYDDLKEKCERLVKSRWVKDGNLKTKKILAEIASSIGMSGLAVKK